MQPGANHVVRNDRVARGVRNEVERDGAVADVQVVHLDVGLGLSVALEHGIDHLPAAECDQVGPIERQEVAPVEDELDGAAAERPPAYPVEHHGGLHIRAEPPYERVRGIEADGELFDSLRAQTDPPTVGNQRTGFKVYVEGVGGQSEALDRGIGSVDRMYRVGKIHGVLQAAFAWGDRVSHLRGKSRG